MKIKGLYIYIYIYPMIVAGGGFYRKRGKALGFTFHIHVVT